MSTTALSAMNLSEALGMIESGNNDEAIGAFGERSRYQVLPKIWAQYTKSRRYNDAKLAWYVASRILEERAAWFKREVGREPDAKELYALYNAPGQFYVHGFKFERLSAKVTERAIRFANLVAQRIEK